MKLRNKKTDKVFDAIVREKRNGNGYSIIVCDIEGYKSNKPPLDRCILAEYNSIAEFIAEWEDYKPAEPSINDKKIRKFVSDWATLTQTTKILVVNRRTTRGEEITEFFSQERRISLEIIGRFDLLDMKEYDITELCGEEEEWQS